MRTEFLVSKEIVFFFFFLFMKAMARRCYWDIITSSWF